MSTLIKRSFVGGEIAPAVQSRVDTAKFEYGLKTCRNFLVMRHGGVQNRPGTKLVGEIFPSQAPGSPMGVNTVGIRLVPFVLDGSNAYVLEFRSSAPSVSFATMRVIKNGAYVSTAILTITAITQANPAVITTSAPHGLVNEQEVFINGCIGMEEMNFRDFRVTVVSPTTFSVHFIDGTPLDSSLFSAYVTGGTAAVLYETTALDIPMSSIFESEFKYVQSATSMIVVNGSYDTTNALNQKPVEIKRVTDTNWTFTTMTFAPTQPAPTAPIATANAGAGAFVWRYRVSAISSTTGEESLPTAVAATAPCATPNGSTPAFSNKVNWTAAAGATEYNVYKESVPGSGFYYLAGIAIGTNWEDINSALVVTKEPVAAKNPFSAAINDQPSCATFFQQRLMFGNTELFQERIWGSKPALKNNFSTSRDVQDDDGLQFDMTSNQINRVQNMINIGKLVVFTSGSENSIEGDVSGVLTPTAINPKQYSQNGSSIVPPLVVGGNALYIQNRGAIVRDLSFEFQSDSYRGNDLTIYASHLFEGRAIVEWAWQQIPQSIVWCVLDNGTVIALTYIREQQIWAWHRHDTDGLVKHICVIPEQGEDFVYMVVLRSIGGVDHYFTERLNTRIVNDPQASDAVFSDCAITSGRPYGQLQVDPIDIVNQGIYTNAVAPFNVVDINGANPNWLANLPLAMRVYGTIPPLGTYKVGDIIRAVGPTSGTIVHLTITMIDFTLNRFLVTSDVDVPTDMRENFNPPFVARIYNWDRMISSLTGLWHLEGEQVSVLADGAVISSPGNSQYNPPLTVTNGKVNLPNPAVRVTAGLPYVCDIETLNIDSPQGETAIDKGKSVGRVTVALEKSRGGFYGAKAPTGSDLLEGLYELKTRDQELYGANPDLITDYADVNLQTEWNSNGRVFIRQTEPLPISILAVAAGGFFPLRP
jgi:hypothetical protein